MLGYMGLGPTIIYMVCSLIRKCQNKNLESELQNVFFAIKRMNNQFFYKKGM